MQNQLIIFFFLCLHNFIIFICRIIFGRTCYDTTVHSQSGGQASNGGFGRLTISLYFFYHNPYCPRHRQRCKEQTRHPNSCDRTHTIGSIEDYGPPRLNYQQMSIDSFRATKKKTIAHNISLYWNVGIGITVG